MKRFPIFFAVVTLLLFVSCGRSFQQRTAKYASVGELIEDRAAVMELVEGVERWGYVDAEGKLVIACRYVLAEPFVEGRGRVFTPEGWGYVASDGAEVVKPQYSEAGDFKDGLAWVQRENEFWGRINTSGESLIPCLYTRIDEPDERGWMLASRDGGWGYLDAGGKEVVPCVYDQLGAENRYGFIPVRAGGKWGFLGRDGKEVLPCFFSYISDFENGYARTNYGGTVLMGDAPRGGLWGLIDSTAREVIPCRYYYLDEPGDGRAAYQLESGGKLGYVDLKGAVAVTPRFTIARPYKDGVAVVSYNNVNFGLIDRNGSEVSSFRYKVIGEFGDGLAPFNVDPFGMNFQGMQPRCGYLDTQGREVIPERYDDAGIFSERRAAVMRFGVNPEDFYDARWGYIAPTGDPVAPFKYHEAYPFSCGMARVFIKGLGYGYIDRKGEEVIPCKYQEAEDFHDFRARVKQYDREMIINEKGEIVEG